MLCTAKWMHSHFASVCGWYTDRGAQVGPWGIPNLLYKHSMTSPMNCPLRSISIADGMETLEIRQRVLQPQPQQSYDTGAYVCIVENHVVQVETQGTYMYSNSYDTAISLLGHGTTQLRTQCSVTLKSNTNSQGTRSSSKQSFSKQLRQPNTGSWLCHTSSSLLQLRRTAGT